MSEEIRTLIRGMATETCNRDEPSSDSRGINIRCSPTAAFVPEVSLPSVCPASDAAFSNFRI